MRPTCWRVPTSWGTDGRTLEIQFCRTATSTRWRLYLPGPSTTLTQRLRPKVRTTAHSTEIAITDTLCSYARLNRDGVTTPNHTLFGRPPSAQPRRGRQWGHAPSR